MAFFITTTAYNSGIIVIPDLDNTTFMHPTVNFDLELNFTIAQISASADLGSLIDNNYISAVYHNIPITSSIMLKVIDLNSLAQISTYTGLLKVENNIIQGGGSIGDLAGFPTQTGNNGKFLTTNGTTLSWTTVSSSEISQTQYFEYLNKNIQDYPYVFNYTGDDITSIDYTTETGVMTKTFNYTLGNVTSIVLSGALPTDLLITTKLLSYDISGNIINISYL